ncbi:MAG: vWA domain-containing protein [Planctomycetota bacterium]
MLRDLTGADELPVDQETCAWGASFLLHVAGLVLLFCLWQTIPGNDRYVLTAAPPDLAEEVPPEDFRFSEDMQEEIGALSDSGASEAMAAAPVEADISEIIQPLEPVTLTGDLQAIRFDEPIVQGPVFDEAVLQKGVGSVGATGAEGAVDRITNEVLLSLDQRPTLVVWLFDQSGSLEPQREQIARRMNRVYDELGVFEAAENPAFARHRDKPLLSVVAQFGFEPKLLTEEPTDDVEAIKRAVRSVKDTDRGDKAREGKENVFRAVGSLVEKFKSYRLRSPRRNLMVVVFTDEAGDDIHSLKPAVQLCRKMQTPVYVVGVPAPFGRKTSVVKYVDPNPEFDQTPQDAPVDTGPESLMPERVKLGFLGGGPQDETLDSGFGPYGLTRLCYETGGTYFAVHPDRRTGRLRRSQTSAMATYVSRFFDPRVMRRYRPDYLPVSEYQKLLQSNRARAALVQAAAFSQTTPLDRVRTTFEKRDEASFAEALTMAQRGAAKLEPKINRLVATLLAGESDRSKLEVPRWQAGYDLAIGRSLAVKVRAEGYNTMLAKAKQGMKFKNERNDTWVIRPSDELSTGSVLKKEAEKAAAYLTRVVEEHEGTPWAYLAARELETPLGWQWTEQYNGVAARIARQMNNNRPRPERMPQNLPPRKEKRPPPRL